MRPETLDPTAGEQARASRVDPVAQQIADPTDPRYGASVIEDADPLDAKRVLDPTDPECGQPVDRGTGR